MPNYVLILAQQSNDLALLESLLDQLSYSVAIATSEAQAMAQVKAETPCLVILAGSSQVWSSELVDEIRNSVSDHGTTIVALTDCNAPSWLPQEENPGFDGFLVKPISSDVLSSLLQSACAKQLCQWVK
jgi:CheY-like chemotaxis protein